MGVSLELFTAIKYEVVGVSVHVVFAPFQARSDGLRGADSRSIIWYFRVRFMGSFVFSQRNGNGERVQSKASGVAVSYLMCYVLLDEIDAPSE